MLQYSDPGPASDLSANSTLSAGVGYWFIAAAEVNISYPTAAPPTLNDQQEFELTLDAGWNLVGNPFLLELDWPSIITYNETQGYINSGDVLTTSGVYQYQNGNYNINSDLGEFEGGWVEASSAVTLRIPSPSAAARVKEDQSQPAHHSYVNSNQDWQLLLQLTSEAQKSNLPGIGMHPKAESSKDRRDLTVPPSPGDDYRLELREAQSGLSKSILPPSSFGQWDFELLSSNKVVNISWEMKTVRQLNQPLYLYSNELDLAWDMHTIDRAEPLSVAFEADNPTYITLTVPVELEEKTRGFTNLPTGKMTVEGKVADADGIKLLMVNNFPVNLDAESIFKTEIGVKSGENILSIRVQDLKGNEFLKDYTFNGGEPEADPNAVASIGKYYALLIAVNEYEDPDITDLDKPIADAESLSKVLTEHYRFDSENVNLLKNATRGDIITALDELSAKVSPQDNLLIFYAGHGLWDDERELGYWIPADGLARNTVDYFRNSTLTDQISTIKSKHTLLIADACFSGAIFKSRRAFYDADAAVNKLYELNSRKAMTSGTLTEVPDRSAFLYYLTRRLEGNSEKYMTAATLFNNIRETVINNSDVIPQYGTIQKAGDEGGEFVFIRRE
ncbi:unnamed protein product [Symbiodinium microadriaticum]|nr:unnamed protein product [Symbiodinium microadriaticum]